MARTPNYSAWGAAWQHIAAGGPVYSSGVHREIGNGLKKLMDAGWQWPTVYKRLQTEPGGLPALLVQLEGVKPPTKEEIEAAEAAEAAAKEAARIASEEPPYFSTALAPVKPAAPRKPGKEPWHEKQRVRLLNQREHREREIQIGRNLLAFGDKMLEVCSPYLQLKRKVSRRNEACVRCGAAVTVEEVHIHPSKVDVRGICKVYQEGADRIRIALGMPKHLLSVRVSDANAEVMERLSEIDDAFKQAIRRAIERKQLSQEDAVEIWEHARALIEAKQMSPRR